MNLFTRLNTSDCISKKSKLRSSCYASNIGYNPAASRTPYPIISKSNINGYWELGNEFKSISTFSGSENFHDDIYLKLIDPVSKYDKLYINEKDETKNDATNTTKLSTIPQWLLYLSFEKLAFNRGDYKFVFKEKTGKYILKFQGDSENEYKIFEMIFENFNKGLITYDNENNDNKNNTALVPVPYFMTVDNSYNYSLILMSNNGVNMRHGFEKSIGKKPKVNDVLRCIRDLVRGVRFLHEKLGIFHTDLTPVNVVYNKEKQRWSIIDFDFSTTWGPMLEYVYNDAFPNSYHPYIDPDGRIYLDKFKEKFSRFSETVMQNSFDYYSICFTIMAIINMDIKPRVLASLIDEPLILDAMIKSNIRIHDSHVNSLEYNLMKDCLIHVLRFRASLHGYIENDPIKEWKNLELLIGVYSRRENGNGILISNRFYQKWKLSIKDPIIPNTDWKMDDKKDYSFVPIDIKDEGNDGYDTETKFTGQLVTTESYIVRRRKSGARLCRIGRKK